MSVLKMLAESKFYFFSQLGFFPLKQTVEFSSKYL